VQTWLLSDIGVGTYIHLIRPTQFEIDQARLIITWVRNPITRFVSAYNYERAIIDTDVTGMTKPCELGPDCLAPNKIFRKFLTGHAYDPDFEHQMLSFQSAEDLAESIYAEGRKGELARKLMENPIEHIWKGTGYYLLNGSLVEQACDRLFVGTVERMDDDLARLALLLDLKMPKKQETQLRSSNSSNQPMSELAKSNLFQFYRDTDYAAMRELVRFGLLPADDIYLGPYSQSSNVM